MIQENPSELSLPRRRFLTPVPLLLFLSPAIGELLSGSSPPSQFFNPIVSLLLVGLYGCGAVLVREFAFHSRLNLVGLMLLGCAYGIIEEGLMCKSFFNPHWGDLGFLNTYGRNGGINWLWSLGLTFYHATVSIMAPILLVQALFREEAHRPWLRRRGLIAVSTVFFLDTLLGFVAFDSLPFDTTELKDPKRLAIRLREARDPLSCHLRERLAPDTRKLLERYDGLGPPPKPLQRAMVNELNRLLPDPSLFKRLEGVTLTEEIRKRIQRQPKGDDLSRLNRSLLEEAYPHELARREAYPFRPTWWQTLGSLMGIAALTLLALRQRQGKGRPAGRFRPFWNGLALMLAFFIVGFVMPGLAESGAPIPALLLAFVWLGLFGLLARSLKRLDSLGDGPYPRAYWAMGLLTFWMVFGALMEKASPGLENYAGMSLVGLGFALWMILLTRRWQKGAEQPAGVEGPF